jgi:hypothetical protein
VFKTGGFEGGIGVFKQGGPFNSTGAGLLNHHTSKISLISFWTQIPLWVFLIRGFGWGIGVLNRGGPVKSTGAGLLNHQTSKNSVISLLIKISLWVFKT